MTKPKISSVMCTFRRFKCVERATNCFMAQEYDGPKELVIYNTDEENPYSTIEGYINSNTTIIIVNNAIDYITKLPYTNVGAIRRDALTHATGDYYVCWDDDDIYLPFFFRQSIDRMSQTNLPSFKPEYGFFYTGSRLSLVKNTLEASVLSDMQLIRKYGFLLETGKEGLGWYTKMRDNRELDQDDRYSVPHYCFNWNDGQAMGAGHKQSGDINNPDNFDNHKKASTDVAAGPIKIWEQNKLDEMYKVYYDALQSMVDNPFCFSHPKELITKYINKPT